MITELVYNADLQFINCMGELEKMNFKESILDRDSIEEYLKIINENNYPVPNQDDPKDLLAKIMYAYFQSFFVSRSDNPESKENKIDYELISFQTDEVKTENEQ